MDIQNQTASASNECLSNIKVRCPHCRKLYAVDARTFYSSEPHFQCSQCQSEFYFKMQDTLLGEMPVYLVEKRNQVSESKCPKCGNMNSSDQEECFSCQVILNKVEGLEFDENLSENPVIAIKWKNVINNYDEESAHREFIDSCKSIHQLPYALARYQTLNNSLYDDEISRNYLNQIKAIMSVQLQAEAQLSKTENEVEQVQTIVAEKQDIKLENVKSPIVLTSVNKSFKEQYKELEDLLNKNLHLIPLVTGLLLVFIGFSKGSNRNAVGLGISLILLGIGINWAKSNDL